MLFDNHAESGRPVEQVLLVGQHDLQLGRRRAGPHGFEALEPRFREAVVGKLAAAAGQVGRQVDDVAHHARHLPAQRGVGGRPVLTEGLAGHAGLALGPEDHLVHKASVS